MTKDTIRRIASSAFFILLGVSMTLGYLHFRKEDTRFYGKEGFLYGDKNWQKLPPGKGPELMQNYMDDQKRIWPHYFRLRVSPNDSILRGFWLDKKMLEEIDRNIASQENPKPVTGYHVFLGKWDTADKRFYCLVARATVNSSKELNKDEGEGDFYDMVEPCPDNCGGN